MNKKDLKSELSDIMSRLAELEARARDNLQNQNFADIVATAKGRVQQLTEHPDLERVEAGPDYVEDQQLPFDQNVSSQPAPIVSATVAPVVANPPGSDFPAQQTRPDGAPPFVPPGAPLATPSFVPPDGTENFGQLSTGNAESGEQKTFHPGDPQFTQENQNQDFRDPNNVDLNKDGTLQTAPNTKGASDVRDA